MTKESGHFSSVFFALTLHPLWLFFCYQLQNFAETILKHLLGSELVTFFQHGGPHAVPSLTIKAAPADLSSQDLLWDLFIFFPPSNLQHMCMYPFTRLVVKFPVKFTT